MKTKSKIILRSFLLVLLLAALIIIPMRWQAWFGMPPEPAFSLGNGIDRVLVTPGEDGRSDRVITWISGDSASMSFVLDGDTALVSPRKISTEGGTTFVYRSPELRLSEGWHRYGVSSKEDTFGDSLFIKKGGADEKFLFIGDIQDREPGLTRAFLRSVSERHPDCDAWLFAGDMIERGHDLYWGIFYEAVQDFAPHTPFLPTVGNHEYSKGFIRKFDPRWGEAFPKTALPSGAFSFCTDYPNARIIVLDTNKLPSHTLEAVSFLKQALTERKDDPFLIVMMHHGVRSMASGRVNLAENLVLGPLFERYGADLVLQGHDHVYARMKKEKGKPLYLTSTTSLKSYGVEPDTSRLEKTADRGRFYLLLEIEGKTLRGKTFREDHKLFDQFTIENLKP